MNKQIVIYDSDCPICRSFSQIIINRDKAGIFEFKPAQSVEFSDLVSGLKPPEFKKAVVNINSDGSLYTGAKAVAEILKQLSIGWRILGLIISLPIIRNLAEVIYRTIAYNRHFISRFIS